MLREVSIYHNFTSFYKRYAKKRQCVNKRKIKKDKDIREIHHAIWDRVAKAYLEDEAGVYIRPLGYMCHTLLSIRPNDVDNLNGGFRREGSGGRRYRHEVLPMHDNKYFRFYLNEATKRRSDDMVGEGVRYRLLYDEVTELAANEKNKLYRHIVSKGKKKRDIYGSMKEDFL